MMFEEWIDNNVKNVLLVEPNFPVPNKSRNHSNFLPIGLLKIASYLREKNIKIQLIRYEEPSNKKNSTQTTFDKSSNKKKEKNELGRNMLKMQFNTSKKNTQQHQY